MVCIKRYIFCIGIEIKVTELNKEGYRNYAKMQEASGNTYMKLVCEETVKDIENNMDKFFNPNTEAIRIDSSYTKLSYPQRVGIICDRRNGSSDEEFLIMAKQSFTVKIFGRMTYGSLDMSNMNFAFSRSRLFCLRYAMSKSYRIPDFCIDNIGLQPDYFIDRTVTDWINFTQDILEH